MQYNYDAIVVGARVAGASTAMLLARHGHRVLLVDRAVMPADTISTHVILRSGVLQLSRWGVLDSITAAGTPPVRHITLGFGEERVPFRIRPEYGIEELYAPRRFLLDSTLCDVAADSGAELSLGTRVTDLLRGEDGRVNGIVIQRDGRSSSVTGRIVIGADGVRSRVAELVAAPVLKHHPPTNAVHYAYYTDLDVPGFWFQFNTGVNAGFIPTNDAVCVFVGRPIDLLPAFRAEPETEFRRLIGHAGKDLADRLSDASRISPFRGTNGLPGFIRRPWGSGWALVGDAGYTKDPISAHGISDALRDAELCARAVDMALGRPDLFTETMRGYQRSRDSLSSSMFRESRALAAYRWDPPEASARMRVVSETVRRECEMLYSLPTWPRAYSPSPA